MAVQVAVAVNDHDNVKDHDHDHDIVDLDVIVFPYIRSSLAAEVLIGWRGQALKGRFWARASVGRLEVLSEVGRNELVAVG